MGDVRNQMLLGCIRLKTPSAVEDPTTWNISSWERLRRNRIGKRFAEKECAIKQSPGLPAPCSAGKKQASERTHAQSCKSIMGLRTNEKTLLSIGLELSYACPLLHPKAYCWKVVEIKIWPTYMRKSNCLNHRHYS